MYYSLLGVTESKRLSQLNMPQRLYLELGEPGGQILAQSMTKNFYEVTVLVTSQLPSGIGGARGSKLTGYSNIA